MIEAYHRVGDEEESQAADEDDRDADGEQFRPNFMEVMEKVIMSMRAGLMNADASWAAPGRARPRITAAMRTNDEFLTSFACPRSLDHAFKRKTKIPPGLP